MPRKPKPKSTAAVAQLEADIQVAERFGRQGEAAILRALLAILTELRRGNEGNEGKDTNTGT